jgi:hypothetical protein
MSVKEPGSAPRTKRDLGPEAHQRAMERRREQFRQLHDFSRGRGLEIGPLDSAIAVAEESDVRYVDVHETEAVRAHYAGDQNVLLELIPEIDYALIQGDRVRTLSEAAAEGAPYDWVVASHVIEHVPDVVGWLRELSSLVAEQGALVLAVPDRRYCFDVHRPPTTTGQAIAAHERGDTTPSVRAVYDFMRSAVFADTHSLWRGDRPPGWNARMHDLDQTRSALERARAGEYVDAHVWTWSPDELLVLLRDLRDLDLCDWYVDQLVELPNALEFHAVLRRLRSTDERDAMQGQETPGRDLDMPSWLFDQWSAQARVRELEQQVGRLRRRNRRLRRRVAELEGSVRMRVGTALLSPLAATRDAVRGRRADRA